MTRPVLGFLLACALLSPVFGEEEAFEETQEEFTFEFIEEEQEPYSLDGYLEFRPSLAVLDDDNVLYRLGYPRGQGPDTESRALFRAHLEGTYDWDDVHLKVRTSTDLARSGGAWDGSSSLHEAYVTWQVDPYLAIDAGKKQIKWGTGYSWSPVAFLDRPKDPDEPDLPRPGFTLVGAEYVKSFSGSLQNAALTLAVVPRTGSMNSAFGTRDSTNYVGRLHLLWHDTDIDLMAQAGGSRPVQYGLDFARNLETNFEIHGEWSHTPSEVRTSVAADGTLRTSEQSIDRVLLGLRYLTESDVTYIVEYLYNGAGFSRSELRDFHTFVSESARQYADTGDAAALGQARRLSRELYSTRPMGRNTLYFRASIKEPHDILYLTPAITVQVNLEDTSFSVIPEVLYTGFENWELRARAFVLDGDRTSEFGAKQNQARFELMARRFF